MGIFACIDGTVVAEADAKVSVFDNGFAFGDSVYETLRTYQGRPFLLSRHLRRLHHSANRLGFGIPQPDAEMRARIAAVLARAQNPESYVRIVASRGRGDLSYRFERVKGPTLVILVKPFEPFPDSYFTDGVPVSLVSVVRNSPRALDPAIKSSNLLNSILATREAQAAGALEALLLNENGELAEGAGSNVFVVKHGVLRTPPLQAGILAGITREVVLELAAERGVAAREEPLTTDDLVRADEAFLTSSLKEVMPIARVDQDPIGHARPGPVTRQLLAAYRERTRRQED